MDGRGLNAEQVALLQSVKNHDRRLSGSLLGLTSGNSVTLDINAAGNGWFVDSTPTLDEEYSVTSDGSLQAIDAKRWTRSTC